MFLTLSICYTHNHTETHTRTHAHSHTHTNTHARTHTHTTLPTYACLLAWSIGHRQRSATVFFPWPSSPSLSFCFLFCVSLPCVYRLTSSPLPWGLPCDGLTGDGFWKFPECVSYPNKLSTNEVQPKFN